MEEVSEAERNKASRPYDGMVGFSEEHKQWAAQLLVTAANLERGYQAFHGSGNLQVFRGRRSRSAGGKAIEGEATTRMRTREQGKKGTRRNSTRNIRVALAGQMSGPGESSTVPID
jgi:hypothetical protein